MAKQWEIYEKDQLILLIKSLVKIMRLFMKLNQF